MFQTSIKYRKYYLKNNITKNSKIFEKFSKKYSDWFRSIPIDFERVHKKENRLGGYNNNVLDIYKIPEILSKNYIMEIRESPRQVTLHHAGSSGKDKTVVILDFWCGILAWAGISRAKHQCEKIWTDRILCE